MTQEIGAPDPNTYISRLIGGFLIDLARAQHMSNEFSKRLGEIYKKDPLLRVFPVPNGYIGTVTMELKAGIQGIGVVGDPPEAIIAHAHATFEKHVQELLESVLGDLADALRAHRSAFPSPEKADRMAEALGQPEWRKAIASEAQTKVNARMGEMVSHQGELNEEGAAAIVAEALEQATVAHPDYAPLPQEVRNKLSEQLRKRAADRERMGRLKARISDRPLHFAPSVHISTADPTLSALGPEMVGRLDLQASVRDYLVQAKSTTETGSTTVVFRLVPAKN